MHPSPVPAKRLSWETSLEPGLSPPVEAEFQKQGEFFPFVKTAPFLPRRLTNHGVGITGVKEQDSGSSVNSGMESSLLLVEVG